MLRGVTTRERAADRGARSARHDLVTVGAEIRTARLMAGKTLRSVGRSVGMSYSQVGRIERAALPSATLDQIARIGAVVGLDIRVRVYPGLAPVRDAGQVALVGRLRARLPAGLSLATEVPLPISGDQRAWDAVIDGLAGTDARLHVEAETRLYDVQAQARRIALKARDGGAGAVLLLVADTPRNRVAVRSADASLADSFPVPARVALTALSAGRHPGGSAVVFL
jgi:transcriptional regulator with XRE-family HTH domain